MFLYYLFKKELEICELFIVTFRQMNLVNRKTVIDAMITTKFITLSAV